MRVFLLIPLFFATIASAQCEMLDSSGDGIVTNTDKLAHIANFGTNNPDSDFNSNGLVDVIDIFTLFGNMGLDCPSPLNVETTGNVVGLVLEEYFVHEEYLTDNFAIIPEGSTTYRLYLETSTPKPQTVVAGCFGTSDFPLNISTSTEFLPQFFLNSCGLVAEDINYLMYDVFTTLEYATWFTTYNTPEEYFYSNHTNTYIGATLPESICGQMSTGEILLNSEVGECIISDIIYPQIDDLSNPNLHLIGQFTTLGSNTIEGTINAYVYTTLENAWDSFEITTGLSFNENDIAEFGCTDSNAWNFNPNAEYDSACFYFGDFDADGEVTVDDVLLLLTYFGCMVDCEPFDGDGDGIVSITDILFFLQTI